MTCMESLELWILVVLVLTVTGALIHCYIMESENTREFGEVSDEETKALYTELGRIRREKTVSDIMKLLSDNGIGCRYDFTTEEFRLYHAASGEDRREKQLGSYYFHSFQDALDWIQSDYINIYSTQIEG